MSGEPGTVFDKNGIPIYPGDLLKSFHFFGRRCGRGRKHYWLYHIVLLDEGRMRGQSPRFFATGSRDDSCLHWLHASANADGILPDTEVIAGSGPDGCLDYEDRSKRVSR